MNLSKAIRLKLSKLAAFGALTAIPIAATGDGGNKVVLNPISVSGDIGINLAAGIADLDLNYAG